MTKYEYKVVKTEKNLECLGDHSGQERGRKGQ